MDSYTWCPSQVFQLAEYWSMYLTPFCVESRHMRSEIWPHTFAIFDKWLWCDTKISYILGSNLKTVMGTFQISSFTCQTVCSMGDVRAVLWYYWHMNGLRWRAKHNLSLWLAVVQYDSCSMDNWPLSSSGWYKLFARTVCSSYMRSD